MARIGSRFEADSKKLIKQLAGFHEAEENFQLCLQFVQSNFNYHRFLTVDSHKLTRELNGIYEKFKIHSQYKKAECFKKLLDEFLESHAFEHRDRGKTDTHYALLSLLLNLADKPLDVDYVPSAKTQQKEEIEKFDWKSYLLDGIEVREEPWLDDSILDSFSDSDEEIQSSSQECNQQHAVESHLLNRDHPMVDEDEGYHGNSWLSRNLVVQYWQGEAPGHTTSHHRDANLTRTWEVHMSEKTKLYVPGRKSELTEYHLVRESLWVLGGLCSSYVYSWNGEKFVVNPNITTSHLINLTITNILVTMAEYGTYIKNLQDFVDSITNWHHHGNGDRDKPVVSQTYEAFAASLAKYLLEFRLELSKTEDIVKKQETTETLLLLLEKLKHRFKEIEILHDVYINAILLHRHDNDPSYLASGLLAALYSALLTSDTKGYQQNQTHLLLKIWLETSRPYWNIVDMWINEGTLRDPHLEFIIQRNKEVKSLDETFWSTAFTTQIQRTANPDLSDKYDVVGWPQFFLPILEHVVTAGKSMEMLQCLGRLYDVVTPAASRQHLYEVLQKSLHDQLGLGIKNTHDLESLQSTMQTCNGKYEDIFATQISQQMYIKGIGDPLMRINIASMVLSDKVAFEKVKSEELTHGESDLVAGKMKPMELILAECVYPHIVRRKDEVCEALLGILHREHQLKDHLQACRHVFLLEAGDTMYDFYTNIFEKLRLHEQWRDVSYLNTLLHEAFSYHFPSYAEKFFVSVESPPAKKGATFENINVLDGLVIHYKVSWPVDVVIHSSSMNVYNQVFHFLLQIKRTKFCLDCLYFTDLDEVVQTYRSQNKNIILEEKRREMLTETQSFLNHMKLLRIRLLHFVNSLHNYIMTRILHSTALELQAAIESAADLDEIIKIHNNFIATIYERCLLHRKVKLLKEAITKILNMTLGFTHLWQNTYSAKSMSLLTNMELELTKYIKFLASFLSNIIKRGSFPHLESLAFALTSSNENFQKEANK